MSTDVIYELHQTEGSGFHQSTFNRTYQIELWVPRGCEHQRHGVGSHHGLFSTALNELHGKIL